MIKLYLILPFLSVLPPFTARLRRFLAIYQPSAHADGNRSGCTGCTGPGPCQTIPVFASALLHKG